VTLASRVNLSVLTSTIKIDDIWQAQLFEQFYLKIEGIHFCILIFVHMEKNWQLCNIESRLKGKLVMLSSTLAFLL
jgi:hypothetical protein